MASTSITSEGDFLADVAGIKWSNYGLLVNDFPLCHSIFPLALICFYLFTVVSFNPPRDVEPAPPTPTTKQLQRVVLTLHNAVLCIFSASCFLNTFPVIFRLWQEGWKDAVCFKIEQEYHGAYGFWTWLFYMSKFYEFGDTWIVQWKGRRPIFLQTFHHVGAVLGMWIVVTGRSTAGYIFVVENSFIHTIMYFYYCCSSWGIQFPFKFMITICQMVQFVTGMSLGLIQLYLYQPCMRAEDVFCIWYHEFYVGSLFVLFVNFYFNTYTSKGSQKARKKTD